MAARLADGFAEWAAFTKRMDVKWANYSEFEPSGSNANPTAAAFFAATAASSQEVEEGSLAAARPKLRLHWEAAMALLAAANATQPSKA